MRRRCRAQSEQSNVDEWAIASALLELMERCRYTAPSSPTDIADFAEFWQSALIIRLIPATFERACRNARWTAASEAGPEQAKSPATIMIGLANGTQRHDRATQNESWLLLPEFSEHLSYDIRFRPFDTLSVPLKNNV